MFKCRFLLIYDNETHRFYCGHCGTLILDHAWRCHRCSSSALAAWLLQMTDRLEAKITTWVEAIFEWLLQRSQ
jgi:hypothetical protein